MKSSVASVLVASTILLTSAARASDDAQQRFSIDRAAMVGGTILPAGTYRVDLTAGRDTAKFVQGKQIVAEAPCRVEAAQVVYRGNAAHVVTGVDGQARLVKIELASSSLAVEFPVEQSVAADAPASKTAGGR